MALSYKTFACTLFDRLLHTQHLQRSSGIARRVLQDAIVHTPALGDSSSGGAGYETPSAFAPTPPTSSGQSQSYNPSSSSFASVSHFSPSVAIIMVALLSAFFFLGFFTLYVRRCADNSSSSSSSGTRVSLRNLQEQRDQAGVDTEFLQNLPLIAYSSAKKRGNNTECVVCLADFEEQEPLRQLPGCKHVFHPDCIDMWLFSHLTCPLCRRNINRASSLSFRWGGSGNLCQFLGGGGGSGQQLGFLSGGGGSGQQLSAIESMRMVVGTDMPESNDITSTRLHRGLSTEMVATSAQGNGNLLMGTTNISNFLQRPFAGMSGNQSTKPLDMDTWRKQATRLSRSKSTGHSSRTEANPLLSTSSGESSTCSRTSSIYRSSSETVKQHGNMQEL